jgi:hypothetical protein
MSVGRSSSLALRGRNVVSLPACLRTRVWARRKTVLCPAGRSKWALKPPCEDGLTVATTVPVPMLERDADARIVTGCAGLSRGWVTVPLNVTVRPDAVTAVV